MYCTDGLFVLYRGSVFIVLMICLYYRTGLFAAAFGFPFSLIALSFPIIGFVMCYRKRKAEKDELIADYMNVSITMLLYH